MVCFYYLWCLCSHRRGIVGPCGWASGPDADLLDPFRNTRFYGSSRRVQHFSRADLGALIYIFLQDTVMSLTPYWRLVFGAMLAFIVIVAPGGVAGVISSLVKKEKRGV